MKVRLCICLICIAFLLSCTGKKDINVITFQLNKADYIEKTDVEGVVQAVVNTPVMPPRSGMGSMTVIKIVQDGAFVTKGDTLCVLSSPDLQSRYNASLISIETLKAELKGAEADIQLKIALLNAELATSEAQVKISSLDSLKMVYATEVQKSLLALQMKKAIIEKQKTEKKLAATKIIGETDIRQKKARIIQEDMKAQTYADQISEMTIIAQRDGIVIRTEAPVISIQSHVGSGSFGGPIKEGSVLFMPGPILQFPDLSKMQISADVAEADFKRIEKGQKVFIKVDAAEKLVTTGKVNRKSLAGSTASRYSRSKVKSYEVIIDVDSCHARMQPGLSSDCEILLKEENDTLFVPTLAIFENDSTKFVYVKNKKKFSPVEVETGTSGSSFTIICGGLKGGEMLALIEPPKKLIDNSIISKDTTNNHK